MLPVDISTASFLSDAEKQAMQQLLALQSHKATQDIAAHETDHVQQQHPQSADEHDVNTQQLSEGGHDHDHQSSNHEFGDHHQQHHHHEQQQQQQQYNYQHPQQDSSQQPVKTQSSSSAEQISWKAVWALLQNYVVLYAGSWRILHDMPGYGILFWTPMLVQALLGASQPGNSDDHSATPAGTGIPEVRVVLLSAIPFAAASIFHVANAAHSQRTGERRMHIAVVWVTGAVALALMPVASSLGSVPAFLALTIAHVGVNGANGCQTGWVASCFAGSDRALGLALYNMLGNIGGFLGPFVVGLLYDATGGYDVAMVIMATCLLAAAVMVLCFNPLGAGLSQGRGDAVHRGPWSRDGRGKLMYHKLRQSDAQSSDPV